MLHRCVSLILLSFAGAASAATPTFEVELEGGGVWQSRNEVQIPNDASATRFDLPDVIGNGPWPVGRLALAWNPAERHGLHVLLAPLSITETGTIDGPVDFAGASYSPGAPLEATYRFNSWRVGYRYRFLARAGLRMWIGFTAKLRDAKVELRQGDVTSKDTDLGFVPLLHYVADWAWHPDWGLRFDFEGLAGGPGRAFDVALKLERRLDDRWSVRAGYRTIEGGADVDAVYNFAWLHQGVVSVVRRF